jgi:TonB family protein
MSVSRPPARARMPTSEAPTRVRESAGKASAENGSRLVSLGLEFAWPEPPEPVAPPPGEEPLQSGPEPKPVSVRGSRWVDYDTHELLEMIGELEDERRWSRLREGIWLAILFHIMLLSAITWIPRYVFHVAPVIDPFDAIKQRKDLTYLDLPPDALREIQPKPKVKPAPPKLPKIDKKMLEALNQPTAPPTPAPTPVPEPKLAAPAPVQPSQPIPPSPQDQLEAPRPAAVPARPNFAMNNQNPADQLRDAMRGASRERGSDAQLPLGGLARHPGAGSGARIISDTQGVNFDGWLRRWYFETEHTWDPLIPDEVNPPILKSGQVQVRFKVLPNGQVTDMVLEGRSGDSALDRAAWGAITGSNYPELPREFHGPYIELRAVFMYNMQPQ